VKQLLFVGILTALGCAGSLSHPFWGVLLYYTFALLQPQDLWRWALPDSIRWSAIASAAALGGALLALPRLIPHMRWNAMATLIALFGVLAMVSAMNAIDVSVANWWGSLLAKVLIMALLASLTIHTPAHLRYICWVIVAILGYIAWEINFMYFLQGGRTDIMRRGHGGLDNNAVGLLIAMAIPFVYAQLRLASHTLIKAGFGGLIILMIHAVMMSFSRMSMLCGIIGCVWLLLHHKPRWQSVLMAVAGVIIVLSLAGNEVRDRFMSIGEYQTDGSANSRFDSWAAAWKMTWDHPLTGVGIRNSNLLSQTYGADKYGRTIHNQYLQLSADLGVPALCVYVTMCLLALYRTWSVRRVCRLHPDDREAQQISMYALAMQTSMIMFCFGAFFLSLETFEISWLILVLTGVLPHVAAYRPSPVVLPSESSEARPGSLTPITT
jgi:probable O-glycosylation ligase (exosortase A-associated)